MKQISRARTDDLPRLFEVWESSVRATHSFLTEEDLRSLMPLAHAELARFTPIHCLRNQAGEVIAFMGVAGSSIEMLYVHADHRGVGMGRQLIEFALQVLGARRVDVNEQNRRALGFYQRFGFHPVGRSARDASGRAFPILHLSIEASDARR